MNLLLLVLGTPLLAAAAAHASSVPVQLAYLVSTALFIFSLHWLNDPKTARQGLLAGVAAMALAILGTMLTPGIVNWGVIAVSIASCPVTLAQPFSATRPSFASMLTMMWRGYSMHRSCRKCGA